MSEHIKTGVEIWGEIKDISKIPAISIKELSEKCFDKRITNEWVSLSWLKEQIQEKKDFLMSCGENGTKEYEMLDWFYSLLEEKD